MITYSQTREIPPSRLDDLFYSVGWTFRGASVRRMISNSHSAHSAWDGRLLVGFAYTENFRRSRTIHAFAVRKASARVRSYQRQGIGTHILQSIIDEARNDGRSQVSLYAEDDVVPFYAASGFEKYGDDMVYRFNDERLLVPEDSRAIRER